jgi:hypothetical protein
VTNGYIRGCNIYNLASAWSYNLGKQTIQIYDNNSGSFETDLRVLGETHTTRELYINNYYVIDEPGAYVFPKEFPENVVINLFIPNKLNDDAVDIIRNVKTLNGRKYPLGHSNRINRGTIVTVILGKNISTIEYQSNTSIYNLDIRLPQFIFCTSSKHVDDDAFI